MAAAWHIGKARHVVEYCGSVIEIENANRVDYWRWRWKVHGSGAWIDLALGLNTDMVTGAYTGDGEGCALIVAADAFSWALVLAGWDAL